MRIPNWKAFKKNTLRGFFTVTPPSGMLIHKVSLHEKNGQRWIRLPSEKYVRQNGAVAYTTLVEFTSRQTADNFRKQVLLAMGA